MGVEAPISRALNWMIGEARSFDFSIFQADGVTAQNITGWALEWVLRPNPESNVAILTKTTGAGITITNGAGGLCSVAIARADTLALPPDIYAHSLRRTDSGSESVLSFGPAVLRYASTR